MNPLLEITVNVSGHGSNYKYRTSDINGSITFNFSFDDLESILNHDQCLKFNYADQPMLEFLNSLSPEQLLDLSYRCLILNYRAPYDEIRNGYYDNNDGESDFLYWIEKLKPSIFTTYSTNDKFCETSIEWDVTYKVINP